MLDKHYKGDIMSNNEKTELQMEDLKETKPKKKGISAIIGFCLALVPYIVAFICFALAGFNLASEASSVVWWILIAYVATAGVPVLIVSIIFGLFGLRTLRKTLSIIGLILDVIVIGCGALIYFL